MRIFIIFLVLVILAGCSTTVEEIYGEIAIVENNRFFMSDCSIAKDKSNAIGENSRGKSHSYCYIKMVSGTKRYDLNGNEIAYEEFTPGSTIKVTLAKPVDSKRLNNKQTNEFNAKEIILVNQAPLPAPYLLEKNHVAKISLYKGEEEMIAELTEQKLIDGLVSILDGAAAFIGNSPSDFWNTIIISMKTGEVRKLEVTGHGYVFVDAVEGGAFSLDKERFIAFIDSIKKQQSEGN